MRGVIGVKNQLRSRRMFELTKPQKGIQKAARDFAKGEFDKELAYELERDNTFPEAVWQKAAELGFIGIHFPENCSGGEMGLLEGVLIAEEFSRKDSSIGGALMLAGFASECLLRHGADELKEAFLPKVAEGEILSSGTFGESHHTYDIADISTTATRQGEEWVINGTKPAVINGGKAGFYVVLCRTNEETVAQKNLSLILVEANRKGISVEPIGKKLGGNMTPSANLTFNDVRVPVSNLIGKEGGGFSQTESFFSENGILLAGQALGNALGAYDRMMDYVKGREQFNRKIVQFQVTRHKIAEMATKIELARLITYKAAAVADSGKMDRKLASMAKMTATRTAMEVGAQTIQLFGGYGFMTEYEVERYYRDAKVIEIQEGAREVQKNIIAEAVIGKIK
jgi:alkylation response protein AidB-like acyl-CoA dehydrogenase